MPQPPAEQAEQLIGTQPKTEVFAYQENLSTACPRCSSPDTQSYPMAYQAGTSFGKMEAASYTFSVGATITSGTTSNQTILASNLKPPSEPSSPYGLITLVICAIATIMVVSLVSKISTTLAAISGVLTFGVSLYYCYKLFRESEKTLGYEYQKAISEWTKSWICLRCGSSWKL